MRREGAIRVLVVDDHPVVREGLAAIIAHEADMEVIGQARNGREALDGLERHRPDVVLLDLSLPDMNGIQVITAARRTTPEALFIAFTIYGGEDDIYRAIEAGARGYLLKDVQAEMLIEAIRTVARGRRYLQGTVAGRLADRMADSELSPREMDVLRLLAAGKSNKEIAGALRVSEGTVKSHVNNILGKLGVESRTQAVVVAIRRGMVHDEASWRGAARVRSGALARPRRWPARGRRCPMPVRFSPRVPEGRCR